ncbi:MAG: DNA recombination protein RmuC, partial [Patescibacteria group bacterium]
VILGVGATYFILRNRQNDFGKISQKISEQVMNLAKEKLGAEKEIIKTDLEGKKDAIKTLVDEIRKQLKDTDDKLRISDKERIDSFSSLKKELETHRQLTHELRGSAEDLKRVLSNNQMRGAFGERVAEDLLKMAGFVIGQDYTVQDQTGASRPDLTLLLPDGTKVQIDVKFPYSNLQRYTEAKTDDDKQKYMKLFKADVKEKIKQIATRDYINPDEKTVDFAIAFIPNEMIFSFIYDQMNDIWEDGMRKKVVLAGPFSFTAMLRLIRQAHSNFQFQQNIHQIISLIQKFRGEYDKFSESVDVLGARLESTSKQFEVVSSTRSRQLGRVIDQIDSQQTLTGAKNAPVDNQQLPTPTKDERLLEE